MASNRSMTKYIFHCKLAKKPVCVKWTTRNGFYADLLEDYGIWERCESKRPFEILWKALYPMILEYNDKKYELNPGDTFWLG